MSDRQVSGSGQKQWQQLWHVGVDLSLLSHISDGLRYNEVADDKRYTD